MERVIEETADSRRRRLASSHIPMDRRHALARGAELPDRARGAVLFADIAGFSQLTSEFAREGGRARGAEILTDTITPIFDRLVDRVHAAGGSVIYFAGDAITCWFDDALPEGAGSAAIERAAACAAAMQSAMAPADTLQTSWGVPVSLGVKVSIAAGEARRFVVGDPEHRRHDILAGRTIAAVATADAHARRGDIVASPEVVAALGLEGGVREWRGDGGSGEVGEVGESGGADGRLAVLEPAAIRDVSAPWPELDAGALEEADLRPWLLGPVYARMRSGSHLIGELRRATPVFVGFGGIDYDTDAAAGEALDAFVRWLQGVVGRYDGHLLQVTHGDKGSLALIAFGAPNAHENDSDRALSAALEIRAAPEALDFISSVRIGIAQGQVWAGAYGAQSRSCYGLLGDQVNQAARLMGMAQPGSVLVTNRLVDASTRKFRFKDVGEITVKGRAEPLLISELVARRSAGRRRAVAEADNALVGREAEVALMSEGLDRLDAGESGVIIIEGEAGIGKSRLIAEIIERAEDMGIEHAVTAGDAIERSTAYHAWRPILRSAFRLGPLPRRGVDEERVTRRIAALGSDQLERAPLLNGLLDIELPDNDLTSNMEAGPKAEARHALVVEALIDERRGEPLLLVIDDAHWLDSASWSLLKRVANDVQPLLTLIVTRPMSATHAGAESVPDEFAELAESPGTVRIALDRLSPAESIALVAHQLRCNSLPDSVADLIVQRAEGNPFFSGELGYALRDRGIIRIADEECALAAGVDDPRLNDLPDSIQGVIAQRIDLLSPDQQLTVRVASVIGRTFESETVADIYPIPEDRPKVGTCLYALESLDITPLESPASSSRFIFKHALTQDVAYDLMTYAQRRSLHRSMAEWYEGRHPDELGQHAVTLAHHWERAEDRKNAVRYLAMAGERSYAEFANAEAVRFLERAIELCDSSSDAVGDVVQSLEISSLKRGEWERQLGDAYMRLGRFEEGEHHLRKALRWLGWPVPEARAELAVDVGAVLAAEGWRSVLSEEPAVASMDDEEASRTRSAYRIYDHLIEIAFLNGQQDLTIYATFKALELAELLGPSPELAQAYSKISLTLGFVPLHDLAQHYKKLAMEIIEAFDAPVALANVTLPLSAYTAGIGAWEEAAALGATASVIFERIGDWPRWGMCTQVRARANLHLARFEDFGRIADETVRNGVLHQNLEHEAWGLRDKGHHLLLTSVDAADALSLLVEALAKCEQSGEQAAETMTLALIANAHIRMGNASAGLEAARRALEMSEGNPPTSFGTFALYASMAEAFLALLELEDSARDLAPEADRACALLEMFASTFSIGTPRALLCRGLFHHLTGDASGASAAWSQSLEAAGARGSRYEEALARFEIGRHAPAGSADRTTDLEWAQQVFEEAGAAFDLERTRAALAG